MIEARLRNQYIRQLCFVSAFDNRSSQKSGPPPITVEEVEHGQRNDVLDQVGGKGRIAQRLADHHRRESHAAVIHRIGDQFDVATAFPGEKSPQ